MRNTLVDFVGNEAWLDHDESLFCPDRAWSVSIREPVARAMSQVTMWMHLIEKRKKRPDAHRTELLHIIQSNYMTWSLVSGTTSPSQDHPVDFFVKKEHLPKAKKVLSRFDFIIDIGGTSRTCFDLITEFMGITYHHVPHSRVVKSNYTANYPREGYVAMNAIDTELYEYAQELIQADCEFFKRIKADEL